MLEAGCAEEARAAPSACGGAQGGALALGGGARSRAFARDWADAYLAHWAATAAAPLDGAAERTFASDQRPLLDLMARHCGDLGVGGAWAKTKHLWTLGPLPETMNVRSLEGPASCASPLFGPLLFVHHKRYVNGGGVRDAVARLDGLIKFKPSALPRHRSLRSIQAATTLAGPTLNCIQRIKALHQPSCLVSIASW